MKSKMWYTALLAALILALGLIAMPRAGAAGGNDDVELVPPPGGENGDPDSGGPSRFFVFRWAYQIGVAARSLSSQRVSPTRWAVQSRSPAKTYSPQSSAVRR